MAKLQWILCEGAMVSTKLEERLLHITASVRFVKRDAVGMMATLPHWTILDYIHRHHKITAGVVGSSTGQT